MLVFDIVVSVRTHQSDGEILESSVLSQNKANFHVRTKDIMQLLDVIGVRYKATAEGGNSLVFEFADSSVRMHPILYNARELNSNIMHNLTTYLTHSLAVGMHEPAADRWLQVLASLRFNPN
ncbi:hypothetical protein [Radicibacter daui]|uniref:hypothetical protein n=1 Tax=Radicibacter daui TaxID=3064829 RepID=UPI00404704C5